jgi:hypothetical protein
MLLNIIHKRVKGATNMLLEILSNVTLHPSLVLAVPALMIFAYALKETPWFPDWIIVWMVIGAGIVVSALTIGWTVEGIMNGMVTAGMSIATHQTYKQTRRRD